MKLLAIDPGPERSAFVVYNEPRVYEKGIVDNHDLLQVVMPSLFDVDRLVIEMIASYGMPVGREVFDTCVWIGRFVQRWAEGTGYSTALLYRKDVKLHLCGQARAKDSHVRTALLDRYGGKAKAIGKKSDQGHLYGISKDVWSALAVAVTYSDTAGNESPNGKEKPSP